MYKLSGCVMSIFLRIYVFTNFGKTSIMIIVMSVVEACFFFHTSNWFEIYLQLISLTWPRKKFLFR